MHNLDFIYNRKSIRDYKEQEVPKEDILRLLDAATYAPSPKHQQNWHFVVVQNKDIVNKMADAVTKSHEYIASLTATERDKKRYMNLLPYYINFKNASCAILVYAKEYDMIEEKILRANNVNEDIIDMIKSSQSGAQGIGAAVENFMLAAASMGYGTCYLTGPSHAKKEIEEIIGFEKEEYSLMAIISLGVPQDETSAQPKRKPLEEVVTFL
jgi:nitroreductase